MGIARAVVQHGQGRSDAGWFDHHPAVREERDARRPVRRRSPGSSRSSSSRSRWATEVTKDEIMAGYLNTAYYGRGAYGIQAAARTYFGKDAKDLNPSQCAFLAAVLKGADVLRPGRRDVASTPGATPEANRKRAEERWKLDPRREGQGRPPDGGGAGQVHGVPQAPEPAVERPAGRPDRLSGRPRQGVPHQQHRASPPTSWSRAATRSTRPSTRRRSTSSPRR